MKYELYLTSKYDYPSKVLEFESDVPISVGDSVNGIAITSRDFSIGSDQKVDKIVLTNFEYYREHNNLNLI